MCEYRAGRAATGGARTDACTSACLRPLLTRTHRQHKAGCGGCQARQPGSNNTRLCWCCKATHHVWVVVAALHRVCCLGAPLRPGGHRNRLGPQQTRVWAVLRGTVQHSTTQHTAANTQVIVRAGCRTVNSAQNSSPCTAATSVRIHQHTARHTANSLDPPSPAWGWIPRRPQPPSWRCLPCLTCSPLASSASAALVLPARCSVRMAASHSSGVLGLR